MTDYERNADVSKTLTEKWEKGELPSGWYYVKNEFGNIFPTDYSEDYDYISDTVIKDFFTEVSEIKEVVEPVPSYEEWKASEKYNKHLEEIIKIYERKDKQATETSIAYNELAEENAQLKERNESLNNRDINLCRIANGIRDENFALKELLAMVKPVLQLEYNVTENRNLIKKINQALGE